MITYLANPSSARVRDAMSAGRIGTMITARQGRKVPADALFAIDNGRGPKRDGTMGTSYIGDRAYLAYLAHLSAQARRRCLFATAPDVLGDAAATLELSAPWTAPVRAWFGLPVALVAQDGLENLPVPWPSFDVLFIGGSTTWKLGASARQLTHEAKARGKRVHMGRVNTLQRLTYAAAIGCDTADGTMLTFGPDVNLTRLLASLDHVHGRGAMFATDPYRMVVSGYQARMRPEPRPHGELDGQLSMLDPQD